MVLLLDACSDVLVSPMHPLSLQFTFASNAATIVGGCLVTNTYKLRLPAAFISAFVISVSSILNQSYMYYSVVHVLYHGITTLVSLLSFTVFSSVFLNEWTPLLNLHTNFFGVSFSSSHYHCFLLFLPNPHTN